MSTSSHVFLTPSQTPDVLGDLLHSLSQPLTSLRCSLELSIDEAAAHRQESVAVALQQTEKVIGMVQLMREYLDAEHPLPEAYPVALAPVLRDVVDELASIAAVEGVTLQLVGTCKATLAASESWLRLALQYLIAAVVETEIERQAAGRKVILLLGEGLGGTRFAGSEQTRFSQALGNYANFAPRKVGNR